MDRRSPCGSRRSFFSDHSPSTYCLKNETFKTTLLNVASGLLDPDEGEVLIDGTDITKLSGRERDLFRGAKIGFVFQTFNLLQGFTALENLLVALMFGPLPKHGHEARAKGLLARVGLADHMHKQPAQLSVGQQQRVAIARAGEPSAARAGRQAGRATGRTECAHGGVAAQA